MKILLFITGILLSSQIIAQEIQVVDFNQLEKRLSTNSDSIIVVNFWATWCKPCVEELPAFLQVEKELKNEKFKLLLVSLDFPTHIEQRVKPFLKKHDISTEVVLLDDNDANTWINKVNPNWDGSIPVTLVFNKNENKFIDGTIEYDELKAMVQEISK